MKYLIILGDGMADYPIAELGGKTPLQSAHKPYMDYLAQFGVTGMVQTIPEGVVHPGSDVANLSVLGYDPGKYYTGRSPIEAVSMGIKLSKKDTAFRCNLVTLSDEPDFEDKYMIDYSSDEITTPEAAKIINSLNLMIGSSNMIFYPGVSYRHCMIWENAPTGFTLVPPHDILQKCIKPYLPSGSGAAQMLTLMHRSSELLAGHPVNRSRIAKGLKPANSIWLWGEGKKPAIPSFFDKYGVKGSVIAAVDLIKGLGICAGMNTMKVEGATGNIDTNYEGKAFAALEELDKGQDFVFVHIEAPDECGHRHEIENKVKAIEMIDLHVIGPLLKGLDERQNKPGFEDFTIMAVPDHATPIIMRTHTNDAVPFAIYKKSVAEYSGKDGYDEDSAKTTGIFINKGFELMDFFFKFKGQASI